MKHDLRYGGALCGKEEEAALKKSIAKSIKSGNWQCGEEARKMEEEACKFLGVKYGILTTSGSAAGLLALSALELPKGSEVIIPAVTFPTIFNIILQCGLVPVVVDCDPLTNNMDLESVKRMVGKKTRAIIAVHALGNPVDWIELNKIAKKHKLITILDNCDGLSTELYGKKVEQYADISFTSFHAAHIVSMGVGGGVFTDNKKWMQNVRMYRDWGRQADLKKGKKFEGIPEDYNPRFVYEKIGYNFQILELQAAMGRVQLRKIEKIKKARYDNFMSLEYELIGIPDIILSVSDIDASVCWFAFPIIAPGIRGELVKHLEKRGIETRSMFAGNVTKHPMCANIEYKKDDLPGADYILHNSFWITCHPRLSKKDLDYIIKAFHDFFREEKKTLRVTQKVGPRKLR
jgi:CDP-6-deoxy-D-xylo-4-hexulose-3-dehydrase